MNCIHDLPRDQCSFCTPRAETAGDSDQRDTRAAYTRYANANDDDRPGLPRKYRWWWGDFPTGDGRRVDVELVSDAPADPVPGGQPHWPLGTEYRVRPAGSGADAWRPLIIDSHGGTFGAKAAAVAYGDAEPSG
jgi:hypothetical protein